MVVKKKFAKGEKEEMEKGESEDGNDTEEVGVANLKMPLDRSRANSTGETVGRLEAPNLTETPRRRRL